MKKLLLCGAAMGVAFAAAPAMAQVDLAVGGHTKNYVGWMSQDTSATLEERNFDMLRESEVHVNVEGTADNGLTYGFHLELNTDGGDATSIPEESYLYLASNLGRVNLGNEDGANYLLQVAAPSADSNIDGLRQYVQPVNYSIDPGNALLGAVATSDGWDYDNDYTWQEEKITYLSPVWSGFQFGLSYTPEITESASMGALATANATAADANDTAVTVNSGSSLNGFAQDDLAGAWGDAYEAAVRYEGNFNSVGFALGAGYTKINEEGNNATLDDIVEWNVGADFDIGAFGIGAIYTENNNGLNANTTDDDETWVVGVDYTTGPYQFGASYYNRDDNETGTAIETERYTGGVIYTLTQGLTLRGSISHIEHDQAGSSTADVDATSVLGGIQFNF